MLSLIVAYGKNQEIGYQGHMPWPSLKEDFTHLQEKTIGHTILMGQRTFESLPGVLPKRFHIIVSDDPSFHKEHKRVRVVRDLLAALEEARDSEEEVVVFGGASIYRAALPYVEKLYITEIDQTYPEADTYFPVWNHEAWEKVEVSDTVEECGLTYRFVTYVRKREEA